MIPRDILADQSAGWRKRARVRSAVSTRIRLGWDETRALDTPLGARGRPTVARMKRPDEGPRPGSDTADLPYSQDVIAMTLVSRCPDGMCLEAIGEHLGLVRERVRQVEASALRKLRAALEREGIEARDIGAWLASRPDTESSTANPRDQPWVTSCEARDKPLAVEPWSEHGQRVEAACRELDAFVARARARRDVARVVEGMEL
jgi:hypothetical protein